MSLLLLLILYIIIILLYFMKNKMDIISPFFAFSIPFVVAISFALFNSSSWNIKYLNPVTFFILLFGLLSFIFGIEMAKKKRPKSDKLSTKKNNYPYLIDKKNLNKNILFILFQLFVFVYTFHVFSNLVGSNSISIIMNEIRNGTLNSDVYKIPTLVKWINNFSYIGGIIYAIYTGYMINSRKKSHFNCLTIAINMGLSIIIYLLGGSRGGAITILIIFLMSLFYFSFKRYGYKKKLAPKIVFCSLILLLIITQFKNFALMMGKDYVNEHSFFEYLSIYLGAQIKNLDDGINFYYESAVIGQQTFASFYKFIFPIFNINIIDNFALFLPFNSYNGISLGNVYTTYFPFYLDFGMLGVILLTFIMGFISQYFYQKINGNLQNPINVFIIIYGYIYYSLIFSFFSDKFFEEIISISFIKYFIVIVIMLFYFNGLKNVNKDLYINKSFLIK